MLITVIGLEIHAQLSTKTKMFCNCDNDAFGKEPNSCVCPVCTGHPGALPVPNAEAIKKGISAALALGLSITPKSKFDRKNYFYPDLPAGYQISQYDEPVSQHGRVEIRLPDGTERTIRVHRLHLENDAGKLTHVGNSSLCDYNRAGTPLIEIVSEPDMTTPAEARAYAEAVQRIVQYVGASTADMYKGEMRFDASVSLRPAGDTKLYPRAEIKNLNSFKALESAIAYEIRRQTKLWEAGTPPASEQTVGWNDEAGETYLMREKESAADYRYFPEPDIPPLTFTAEQVEKLRAALPELPFARKARFIQEYGMSEQDAETLIAEKALADYFEEVVQISKDPKKSVGWVLSELGAKMKEAGLTIGQQKVSATHLGQLVARIVDGTISGKIAKDIFPEMWEEGSSPDSIIEKKGLKQVSDTGAIEKIVDEVLAANPKSVEDFRAGKTNAIGFLVGQIMKASKGQANPKMVNEILVKKLGS